MSYHIPCAVVTEIRDDHESDLYSIRDLALIYHVSETAIHDIVTYRSHQDCAHQTQLGAPKSLGQFLAGD